MRRFVLLLSVSFMLIWGGLAQGMFAVPLQAQEKASEDAAGAPRAQAPAQDGVKRPDAASPGAYTMDGMVVVAPPVIEGNDVNRLGSQVTTVTEKQIEDLNAQDLPSALRQTPGVVVSHHNPIGSFGGGEGGAIFIRGMGVSRPGAEVQILVDGVPKFVSVWTHPLMDVLSVDIIDHMQVYKGAQPVLFGNMAFAGVDITTKRQQQDGFYSSVEAAGGSFNTWVEVAEHAGKVEKFDYYLVQSFRSSDGHRDNADGELQDYFGHVGFQLDRNWYASLVFNHSSNWADDPGPVDHSTPPDGRFKVNDYFAVATVSHQYEKDEGYVKFYSDTGDIDWTDQYNETTGRNEDDTLTNYSNYGMRVRETVKPWEGGQIMAGFDLDYLSGKVEIYSAPNPVSRFDRTTWNMFSPYLAVSQLFGSKDGLYAIPSAGARYIHHSEFEDEPGPQLGLIIGYKDTETHVSYARGINYPGIFAKANDELFMPGDNRWQDLTAELVDHFEAGVSQKFGNKVKADLTYFHDKGKDRIVVSPPPPFPPTWENIGSYTTQGAEATVTVFPLPDLAFFAGGTYLKATPDDLPYAPKWSASFGANYRFLRRFQISVDGSYVDGHYVTSRGRQENTVNVDEVGSYFLLNAKLTYDFVIPYMNHDFNAQLFVAGENLADADYEQKKGYPMPGVSGMGGIKLRF